MEPIKLSIHQYLLLTEEPVLIQTGAVSQAPATLPKLMASLLRISWPHSSPAMGLWPCQKDYDKEAWRTVFRQRF